ncbi:MAG TPA: GNAT family N-acetyltransferase [Candidatus Limnocylindrales bacterium]|nr:GNAT family N-acetyltransferase [Candidatus Limnocylindrales bacterium]
MTLRIRFGELADVPLIAELIRGLARYERLEDQVVMTEEKLTDSLFGERPYAETLIAEDDGQPAGFALFFHNYSTFLAQPGIYLEDLFVVPEKRGAGIGRALLARLAQIAVERNCGRLEWSVLDWNKDAIGFYERLGAKPNSEWTVYRLSGEPLRALAGE